MRKALKKGVAKEVKTVPTALDENDDAEFEEEIFDDLDALQKD